MVSPELEPSENETSYCSFLAKAGKLRFRKILSGAIKIPTYTEYVAVLAVDEEYWIAA